MRKNLYGYSRNNPISFVDPVGLENGIWVEGSAGGTEFGHSEPMFHQSITVGDPYGYYYSQSFGNVDNIFNNQVYEDKVHGSWIEKLAPVTKEEPKQIEHGLRWETGRKTNNGEGYNVFTNSCRSYTTPKFDELVKVYGLKPTVPPRANLYIDALLSMFSGMPLKVRRGLFT